MPRLEDKGKMGYKRGRGAQSQRVFIPVRSTYIILSMSKGHGVIKKNSIILVALRSFKTATEDGNLVTAVKVRNGWFSCILPDLLILWTWVGQRGIKDDSEVIGIKTG